MVGLVGLVGAVLVFNVGVWWWIAYDESHPSAPGPERVRLTAEEFRERSEQAIQDTVRGLSPALVLSDTGFTVRQHERRPDGEPSRLAFVDRQLTARTKISASHRAELKNGIETAWQERGYKQVKPMWTPSEPEKGPDYNFSAESSEGVSVYVSLVPGPDQTITFTLSIRGDGVAYAPDSARPTSTVQPDVDDAHWSQ
ncbi:hypothetical protein ABZW30_43785 [Kitasatospora sp. NPDC004669]|uniref:hypothetical protein n=1 Tax=Kitasatospora sp. NPDC004669 TaxID=3154555 RepID=UPI0033BA90A5